MKKLTLALAGLTALAASPASAQSAGFNLSADEVAAGVRYFMPQMIEVVQDKCSGSLSPDGYLSTNGDALIEKFSVGSEESWDDARVLFMSLAMEGGADQSSVEMFEQLPEEALKPLLDSLLPMELGKRIKTRDCGSIERVMETLDPLPAENFAQFVGVVFELALKDRGKKNTRVSAE